MQSCFRVNRRWCVVLYKPRFNRLVARDSLLERLLLLVIACSWTFSVVAQRVRLEGVSVSSGGRSGTAALPPYADFINATRDPVLFRGATRQDAVADGTTSLSNLALDFDFSVQGRQRHAFSAGFARQALTTTLYAMSAADSLSPGIDLTSTNEYFILRSGYRYRLWPKGRISVFAGLSVEVGTPVSALSKETVSVAGDSLAHENAFFARRSGLFAVRLPVGIRVKLTNTTRFSFALNPSRLWTRLDGNRVTANLVGSSIGLQFRFRRRDG